MGESGRFVPPCCNSRGNHSEAPLPPLRALFQCVCRFLGACSSGEVNGRERSVCAALLQFSRESLRSASPPSACPLPVRVSLPWCVQQRRSEWERAVGLCRPVAILEGITQKRLSPLCVPSSSACVASLVRAAAAK